MRKGGVKLTTSISYIEPCKLRDKTIQNAKEIDCTKVFFGDNFIVLEMTILDFLKESEPQISYL